MSIAPSYAPELRLLLDGRPAPGDDAGVGHIGQRDVRVRRRRPSWRSRSRTRPLRWLDHDLLRLDTPVELWLGYSPDQPQRVFAGEVVGSDAGFPSSGMPTLTVVAQDRRTRLAAAEPSRWFAVPVPFLGVMPIPDVAVAPVARARARAAADPRPARSRCSSAALGAVEAALSIDDPDPAAADRAQAGRRDVARLPEEDRGRERLGDRHRPRRRPGRPGAEPDVACGAPRARRHAALRALAAGVPAQGQHGRSDRARSRPACGSRPSASS